MRWVLEEVKKRITVHDDGSIDVIGWRYWYREPTKWGLRTGYWHEVCQEKLLKALEHYLQIPPKDRIWWIKIG